MTFAALNDEKKDYQETKNILEYTLFFDLKNKNNYINGEGVIHGIFEETNEICKDFSIPSDIFGTTTLIETYNRCKYDEKVISLLLRNHCIITALYTAKYLLLSKSNTDVSPYRIAKYFCDMGYFELRDTYNIEFGGDKEKDRVKIKYKEDNGENDYYTLFFDRVGYIIGANNFLQAANKYKKHVDINNYTKKVLIHSYGQKGNIGKEYFANCMNSDLYYNTVRYSNLLMKRLVCLKSQDQVSINDAIDLNKVILEHVKKMRDSSASVKTNKADILLYKYQIERYYPYLLFHEMVKNHNKVSKQYLLTGDIYYFIMSKFNMLPNAFSRRFFINWAYNAIEYTHLHENYWSHMKENNKTVVGLLNDTTFDTADRIHTWMTLINDFIYYASYITFPIYEKTFFIKLYEFYENKAAGNALNLMIEALTDYVDDYYDFLTYDFGDGELMNQYITYKIANMKPSEFEYKGIMGSNAANEAYIKFFIKNYNECNYTDIKEKNNICNKNESKNTELINPLQKPIDLASINSAKFYYELARNTFSIPDIEDYYNRTFSKDYFRIPIKKSFDISKLGIEYNGKNLPIYNRNFAYNQINEIMKIQKYAEINKKGI